VTSFVATHGVYAVFVLMLIDALFPVASELIMVVGGALAAGVFSHDVTLFGHELSSGFPAYLAVALAGTIGYLIGSMIGWWIGARGGRPFLQRHGRWFHLTPERLGRAERWFERWGDWAVLLGRVTPVVRSFVSIPAGVFRMPFGRYTVLTAIGSAIWAFGLAAVGWALGSSYETFHHDFRFVEYAVAAGIAAVAVYLGVRWRRSTTLARRAEDSAH
jgi:membrane protein DedA with SNARE-associated domain